MFQKFFSNLSHGGFRHNTALLEQLVPGSFCFLSVTILNCYDKTKKKVILFFFFFLAVLNAIFLLTIHIIKYNFKVYEQTYVSVYSTLPGRTLLFALLA